MRMCERESFESYVVVQLIRRRAFQFGKMSTAALGDSNLCYLFLYQCVERSVMISPLKCAACKHEGCEIAEAGACPSDRK